MTYHTKIVKGALSAYLSLPCVVTFTDSKGRAAYLPRCLYVLWAGMNLLVGLREMERETKR